MDGKDNGLSIVFPHTQLHTRTRYEEDKTLGSTWMIIELGGVAEWNRFVTLNLEEVN